MAWFFIFRFEKLYNRITIEERIPQFISDIREITRYHERREIVGPVGAIIQLGGKCGSEDGNRVVQIMLELLITDLKIALQKLFVQEDIKVGVLKSNIIKNNRKKTPHGLKVIATTQFIEEHRTSTIIEPDKLSGNIPGFCGDAWRTKLPSFGSRKKNVFQNDPRFVQLNIYDKNRSFLCLPIFTKPHDTTTVEALICIDSCWKKEFLLPKDIIDVINIELSPVKHLVYIYISMQQAVNDLTET